MGKSSKGRVAQVLRIAVTLLFSVAVLGGGISGARWLMNNRKVPVRTKPPVVIPAVEVLSARVGVERVTISVMGTVVPAVEVGLQSRVSGQIVSRHPEFTEGGIVTEGEVLVEIDPTDFELALTRGQAQLETARYELRVEEGQQDVAQREWELLGEAEGDDSELALRRPQLRQRTANVKAAEAIVEQAQLNLERTRVLAPFNAIVQTARADPGDQATAQTMLGQLIGTDAYWVQVSVPLDELTWIDVPRTPDGPGSPVRITTGTGSVREGRVYKLLSDLEPQGRLARLLIEVRDPLGLQSGGRIEDALLLGDFVHADIVGHEAESVTVIPRDALRDGSTVWLMDSDGTLSNASPEIVWRSADRVFLRGLEAGDRIITSDLAAPIEGMKVRLLEDTVAEDNAVEVSP